MAETPGIKFTEVRDADKHGTDPFIQTSDGTGEQDHLAKYDALHGVTDSLIPVSDLLTTSGAGGTTKGMTPGEYGSWIGQVPRGAVDGNNRKFYLDFKLLNPYTVLSIGKIRMPSIQHLPGTTFGTEPVPGGEYTIDGYALTTAIAPQPDEDFYIEYQRAEERPTPNQLILHVRAAFTAGTSGSSGQSSFYGTAWSFGRLPWLGVSTTTPPTDYTYDVTVESAITNAVTNPDTFFVSFFIAGGSDGPSDGLWDIYDAYIAATFPDGSTGTYRPTRSWTQGGPSAHMVETPPTYQDYNAIDGDLSTCARIQADNWNSSGLGYGLGGEFEFRLDQFVLVGSTPPPTPVGPTLAQVTEQSGNYTLPANLSGQTVAYTGTTAGTFTLPAIINPPAAPTLGQVAGGTNAATTYYGVITYVNANGETVASAEANIAVSANNVPTVNSPVAVNGATGYNVYMGITSGGETKQNTSTVPIGTNWTMPTTGIQTSNIAPPLVSTASPSSSFIGTISNTGTGNLTVAPPTGSTVNGSTTGIPLAPGQTATVTYNPTSGTYTATTSASGTVTMGTGSIPAGELVISNGGTDVKGANLTGDVVTAGSTATIVEGIQGIAVIDTVPTNGQVLAFNGTDDKWEPKTIPEVRSLQLVIGNGSIDASLTPPPLLSPGTGSFSVCKVAVKSSDPSTPLTFNIYKNGTSIFSTNPTVPANTPPDTVVTTGTFATTPLVVAQDDPFKINITSGSPAWSVAVLLR